MTRDEALSLLESSTTSERLAAARYLGKHPHVSDLPLLRKVRRTEVVSYIKSSLDATIAKLSNLQSSSEIDPADERTVADDIKKQIKSQAVRWISGLIIHEIASPMGLVKRSASREIENFETSKTKHHLELVERIFKAIEQLKNATSVPKPEEFDLAETLHSIVSIESKNPIHTVSLLGPKPLMIHSDETLVRLAVGNGLRNAFEAVSQTTDDQAHPIIITWGITNVDYWIAIIDRGQGIIGPSESAFEFGKSTKQGHSGFGLAIARQAMETLRGTVTLQPHPEGGARFEARWERP